MTIQVNSDHTIGIDARLTSFVEGEVQRRLDRFVTTLTRVEIHLSDVDKKKSGQADKRCLVEVRPAGGRPLSTSATATKLAIAISSALGKMQRTLTALFGREGRTARTPARAVNKTPAAKAPAKRAATSKTAAKKAAASTATSGGPKKKRIYQARRKAWPVR